MDRSLSTDYYSNESEHDKTVKPHLCFWEHSKQGQFIWKQTAAQYTRQANRSGIFPSTSRVISIGDVHGDFHLLQTQLLDVAQVIRPISCPLHDQYPNSPSMCYEWIGGNTTVIILGDYTDRKRQGTIHY